MASDPSDPHAYQLAARLREAEAQLRTARSSLLAAEQANAQVGELREGLNTALDDLAELRRERAADADRHAEELAQLQRALAYSEGLAEHLEQVRVDLQDSISWKVTAPLRAAKRTTHGRPDPA